MKKKVSRDMAVNALISIGPLNWAVILITMKHRIPDNRYNGIKVNPGSIPVLFRAK